MFHVSAESTENIFLQGVDHRLVRTLVVCNHYIVILPGKETTPSPPPFIVNDLFLPCHMASYHMTRYRQPPSQPPIMSHSSS